MNPQSIVHNNCQKRGYVDGWEPGQFMARNLWKLIEEVYELYSAALDSDFKSGRALSLIQPALRSLASHCESMFVSNDPNTPNITPNDTSQIKKELADVQVVLFNIAAILEKLSGEKFDVVEAAVLKSDNDVSRGIKKSTSI